MFPRRNGRRGSDERHDGFRIVQVTLQETKSMPEGAKERGVGLSGSLDSIAAVEKIIFEKLEARRATSLAPSPAEVSRQRIWIVSKFAVDDSCP